MTVDDQGARASAVKRWLEQSGYSLELRVVKSMQDYGHIVTQSLTYRDVIDPDAVRETDVTVFLSGTTRETARSKNPINWELTLVIECKQPSTKSKAWVAFTWADSLLPYTAPFLQLAAVATGDVGRLREIENVWCRTALFARLPVGVGLVTAFDNQNSATAALKQVLSATYGLASEDYADEFSSPDMRIFMPILVTTNPLYSCWIDAQNEILVEPVDRILVRTQHPASRNSQFVLVMTEEHFVQEVAPNLRELHEMLEIPDHDHDADQNDN